MTPPEGAISSNTPTTDSAPPPVRDPAARRQTQFAYLGVSIACYLAFGLIVPMIHFRPHRMMLLEAIAIGLLPTLIFMLLQMWVPWRLVQIGLSLQTEAKALAVFAFLWIMLVFGSGSHPGEGASGLILTNLSNLTQTIALGLCGAMLARIVREAKILLPLGIVAGLIDIVGAMTPVGFTAHMVKSHPDVVSKVSVHVPAMAGLQVGTIGPGDLLFIAFFFAVVHAHKLNTRWTFRLVYALLTLSMLAVMMTRIGAIGALAPMGVAVIVANWKYFTYSRAEKFAMLYASLLSIAAAIGFFQYANSYVFRPEPGASPTHGPAARITKH